MRLAQLLTEEVVKIPLVGSSKSEVIRELVDLLDAGGRLEDPEAVYRALIEREELASTGLEMGVAVPHCKCNAVADITIGAGVHPVGVNFDSIDGKPSRLFFVVIAAPSHPTEHLGILSEIGQLAQSAEILRSLMDSPDAREFVRRFDG